MKSKVLCILLAMLMVTVLFVGCGSKTPANGTDDKAPDNSADVEDNQAAEGEQGEEAPVEPALDYPKETIKVIIPKGAGGGTDTTARGLLQFVNNHCDAEFLAENNPGGGGVIGMTQGALAEPDGYTLTMCTVELAMMPHQGISGVTPDDFRGICAPIADPACLVVPADSPYNNVDEFVAAAKENPDTITVGNSGTGAIWHLAAVAMEDQYDIKVKHVPYADGTSACVAALVGGHIQAAMSAPSSVKAQVEAGELKILGVMSDERSAVCPDVPTFKELGLDFSIRAWAALCVPKDTPQEIVDYLVDAFKATCEDPEFVEYMANQGITAQNICGDDCDSMMKDDFAYFKDIIAKMDLSE